MTNDTERIKDLIDRVEAKGELFTEEFDQQFKGQPYGLHSLTDEQHATWYEQQVAKYPPEAFQTKDGQIIVGSPWVLMLPYTTNGEAETRRYLRTRARGGGNG